MKLATLTARLAERAGCTKKQARAVLDGLAAELTDALIAHETVRLPKIGVFRSRWRDPRTIRNVQTARKIEVPGTWTAHFKPVKALREALGTGGDERTQRAEQQAVVIARTLVSDLALYGGGPPSGLRAEMALEEIRGRCSEHYGNLWFDAVESFDQRIPYAIRKNQDYLGLAARDQLCSA